MRGLKQVLKPGQGPEARMSSAEEFDHPISPLKRRYMVRA